MAKSLVKFVDEAGEPLPAFVYKNGEGVAAADVDGIAALEDGAYEARALGYKQKSFTAPSSSPIVLSLDSGGEIPEVEITAYRDKKKNGGLILILILLLLWAK